MSKKAYFLLMQHILQGSARASASQSSTIHLPTASSRRYSLPPQSLGSPPRSPEGDSELLARTSIRCLPTLKWL